MTDEGHGTSYITWFDLEPDDICRHESEVIMDPETADLHDVQIFGFDYIQN